MSTIGDFDAALKAFANGKNSEMESAIKSLFAREDEIDNLRRTTLEELSSSELPEVYRQDLRRLVNLLDEFADQVKDSARNVVVLAGAQEIPSEIMGHYLTISHAIVDSVGALGDCIETLGIIPSDVKAKAERVDRYEDSIDEEYLNTKMLLLRYGGELEPVTLIVLRDLLDCMERASDTCARTAAYIRILAASEMP